MSLPFDRKLFETGALCKCVSKLRRLMFVNISRTPSLRVPENVLNGSLNHFAAHELCELLKF